MSGASFAHCNRLGTPSFPPATYLLSILILLFCHRLRYSRLLPIAILMLILRIPNLTVNGWGVMLHLRLLLSVQMHLLRLLLSVLMHLLRLVQTELPVTRRLLRRQMLLLLRKHGLLHLRNIDDKPTNHRARHIHLQMTLRNWFQQTSL